MALRIALFGQAAFGKDVLVRLLEAGHEVVGVYVPPDEGRPDPLAAEAAARGLHAAPPRALPPPGRGAARARRGARARSAPS